MSSADPIYQTYSETCELGIHNLLIPHLAISDDISMPLPTKRLSIPAYAYFAYGVVHLYDEPVLCYPPDRWWAIQAQGGHPLLYAQTRVLPFAEGTAWSKVTLPRETRSIPEQKRELEPSLVRLESFMDPVVLPFFEGQPGERKACQQASRALLEYLPAPMHLWYRALAPDFFAWLAS